MYKVNQSLTETYSQSDILLENQQKKVSLRSSQTRWIALILACFTCVGDYYCGNLTQALQTYLMEAFKIDPLKFNTISSAAAVPNIVLPLIGGLIIDLFGIRPTFAIAGFIVIIGQVILTYGVAQEEFKYLIIGKLVGSIGAGPLFVAKSAMLVKWFVGKELSFALGAALCVSRLGSSLDSVISPAVYTWTEKLHIPFVVGTFVCVFAWITILSLNFLDRKADLEEQVIVQGEPAKKKVFTLSDIMKSKRIFFLIAFSAGLLYGAFFGFTGNLNDHMVKRFGFEPKTAGLIIPIIYVCPSVITPIFGKYTDNKGQRVKMVILATIVFLISHLYIAYLPDVKAKGQVNYDIIFGLIGIGVFYSIYAAVIWPCIALVVDEKLTGIAYGFTASIQSLILTFLPLILGDINVLTKDEKHGYFWSQMCLAGIVVAGLMLTIIVYFEDKLKNGARLDRPGTDRENSEIDEKPERTESTL